MKHLTLLGMAFAITACATSPDQIYPSSFIDARDIREQHSCEDIRSKQIIIKPKLDIAITKQEKKYQYSVLGGVMVGVGLFAPLLIGVPVFLGGVIVAVKHSTDDGTVTDISNLKGEKQAYDLAYEIKCFEYNKTLLESNRTLLDSNITSI